MNSYYSTPTTDANDDFDDFDNYTDNINMQTSRHTKRARLDQWTAEDSNSDYVDPVFTYPQAELPVSAAQPYTTPTSYSNYPSTAPSTYSTSAVPMAAPDLASPESTPNYERNDLDFVSMGDASTLGSFE
jgi:hypothetical protein